DPFIEVEEDIMEDPKEHMGMDIDEDEEDEWEEDASRVALHHMKIRALYVRADKIENMETLALSIMRKVDGVIDAQVADNTAITKLQPWMTAVEEGEIWLQVQQMMKGSDIGIQEKKAKLFNEWERVTSNERELTEAYYHRFLKLMNDLKRNKHFPKKIASNLKFLNNLQPKWSRHVTIVHQTKDLHTADYTQLYDFLKYNQTENYLQQPMPNPEDITDPTDAMNMALALMAKAFKLNYSTPTNNNQRISSNPRNWQIAQLGMNMGQDRQMQMVGGNGGNQFRQYAWQNAGNPAGYNDVIENQIRNGNLVAARAEGNAGGQNGNQIKCYNCRGLGHYARTAPSGQGGRMLLIFRHTNLDEIEEVNANYILMANLQQASTLVPQNDNDVIFENISMEQGGETVEQHPVNFEETRALYESLYQNLAIEVEKVNSVNHKLLDKQIQLEKRIKELNNIVLKMGQSIQTIHMLTPKPDSFYHTEQKMDLGYQNPFYLKQAQKKQQSLYDGKVLLEKYDPPVVHDSEETL
nr:hypothetical protein [Tanacetum cinerariifolium]